MPRLTKLERELQELTIMVQSVTAWIRHRVPRHVEMDDLFDVGLQAAIAARRRFDPKRGAKLSTFLQPRILGAILDRMREMDPVGRVDRGRGWAIERARCILRTRLMREPYSWEVARVAKLAADEINRIDLRGHPCMSLDAFDEGEDKNDLRIDRSADARRLKVERLEQIELLLQFLPLSRAHELRLFFLRGWTLKEIGAKAGIGESMAGQRIRKSVAELRVVAAAYEMEL